MIKDEYSPYKIVHHYDKIEELRNNRQPNPVQVHVVPTNKCNQSCTFCAYRIPENLSNEMFDLREQMSKDELMGLIPSFVKLGVKAVQITGGGEPLVHPNIKEFIKECKRNDLEIALVTNGMAMDDELIDLLVDVSWVRFSVDASTPATYSLIRRTKKEVYYKVLHSIGELVKRNKNAIIGVGFVVNKENYREIYDACKIFKELGVDNFRISAAFTPLGYEYFDGILDESIKMSNEAKLDFESDDFTVFNLFDDRISDLFDRVQDYDFCPIKDLVPYIGADYNVYTCCILAYNHLGLIGSLKEQTFYDLWMSDEKRKFYNDHDPRMLCKLPCMFERKNKFINYCINNDAKHINFI